MNKLLAKSFLWMFVGLLVTFLTGYVVAINENMLNAIYNGPMVIILVIVELALVIYFSTRIAKMQPTAAKISYLLYAFVSGLTFSSIFVYFEVASIMYVFAVAALLFGLFGLIGYKTNLDLSKIGTYLLMALIGVIICTIINLFVQSGTFDLVLSIITILIFMGFTAYDVKNIIKHNIDYTIDRSFYIKDIDKYVIEGEILTLNKKIRSSKKSDIMKLTKLASALIDTKTKAEKGK